MTLRVKGGSRTAVLVTGLRQPHIQQPAAFVLEQPLHRAGGGDFAAVGVGFVILLDVVEPVERS